MNGIERIAKERKRQIEEEGWSEKHDDSHKSGEMAKAGACYAVRGLVDIGLINRHWPWSFSWWKPSPENRIRELEKAGALIAAEIDRLQRLA